MNKFGLTLLVLFLGYASSLEIASVDCDGRFSLLPSYPIPIQFDFSSVLGVADTFLDIYKNRLKCLCSDLTDEEFNRLLHPFFGVDMAMNMIQGQDADLSFHSRCNWSDFEQVHIRANYYNVVKFNLTDTCSYETWMRDNKCFLQSQTFSDWDVTFKAAMFRCPQASWRPSVRIICEGKGCDQAFIPCMSNSDCAGDMTCQKLLIDDVVRPSPSDIVSAFRTMLLAKDTPESCIDSGNFIKTTVDIVRKIMKKGSADYTLSELQFCSPITLKFQSDNSTFDWANLFHYSNTSFVNDNNSLALPGYLQPWNGDLISGGKITPPQITVAKPSTNTMTPGATLLVEKTCDVTFNLMPSTNFGFQFNLPWAPQILNQWVSTVLPILKCRFNALGVSITDQELITRWGLGLDNIFFTTDAETRDDPITRGDLKDFRLNFDTRLEYPSSCNYDSWTKSGSCYASYTGLSDLLGTDITINLEILKCPGSQDVKARVECVGEACSLLTLKTKPCNTDADCPSSLRCKDLGVQFGDYDWIGAYAGTLPDSYYSNNQTTTPSSDQCVATADQIHAETRKLLFSFWNLQYDGSSANKYCTIDYDHVQSQVSTWAKGEVETTSPGVVKLKNLKSMNEEGKSWASSVSSNLVLLLIVGLLNLMF